MKHTMLTVIVLMALLPSFGMAQDCDSLIIGDRVRMMLSNGSPSHPGAAQFGSEFLYGKLEIVASSSKWISSIGFESDLSDTSSCRNGIVLSNGALVVYRSFPGADDECAARPLFKRTIPVPGWETLKETENRYTFIWREDNVELLINDNLVVSDASIPRDSIPNQPLMVTFRTNIGLEFEAAGVIDTVETSQICYSYLLTSNVADRKQTPQGFSLSQNYPNPFNPETTIRYHLPGSHRVSLHITDALGQRIRTLVDEEQAAGVHTARWDGKDDSGREVASGMYLYRIVAGEVVITKKLTLVR